MMIHNEYDAQLFEFGMLLLLGAAACGVYGLLVIIGLLFKLFRSLPALLCALAVAALLSVPLLWVVITQWDVLPRHWDSGGGGSITLFVLNVALLTFVWVAPIAQYWRRPRKSCDATAHAEEPP